MSVLGRHVPKGMKCMTARLADMQQRLESLLTLADFERISGLCNEAAEKTFVRTRRTHL